MNIKKRLLLVVIANLLLMASFVSKSQTLYYLPDVDLDVVDYYLLDVYGHDKFAAQAVDSYFVNGQYYIAVTPFLEGLLIKNRLDNESLTVDLNGNSTLFLFSNELTNANNEQQTGYWFRDDIYTYISLETLKNNLNFEFLVNTSNLRVEVEATSYEFPFLVKTGQDKLRRQRNFVRVDEKGNAVEIIDEGEANIDQYRLLTVPQGSLQLDYGGGSNINTTKRVRVQAVSDLLYHSTQFVMSSDTVGDTESNLFRYTMSRYPRFKDDKILGIWDTYQIGDIYTRTNNQITSARNGIGIELKSDQNGSTFNNEGMQTDLVFDAPAGWEADLYDGGRFIQTLTVPENQLLVFSNQALRFGVNNFIVKLYGPYGEELELRKTVDVRTNPISTGQFTHNFAATKKGVSLLSSDSDEDLGESYDLNLSYGINKYWSVTGQFSQDNNGDGESSHTANVLNRIILPNIYWENNISSQSDGTTSFNNNIATRLFYFDSINLRLDSTKDAAGNRETDLSLDYSISLNKFYSGFNYTNVNQIEESFSNYSGYAFRYASVYNRVNWNKNSDAVTGTFGVNTPFYNKARIALSLPYNYLLDEGEFELSNATLSLSRSYVDESEDRHNLRLDLSDITDTNLISGSYSFARYSNSYDLLTSIKLDSENKWSGSIGFRTSFGYDYHNNKINFSSATNVGSGAIDVYAYLDRRLNGIPDKLDYGIEGVTFKGNKQLASQTTNENGRAYLIGLRPGLNRISADWIEGTQVYRNKYMIYSHPGAKDTVNLPFYLTTEIDGFVSLMQNGAPIPLRNVRLSAKNHSLGEEFTLYTDIDGYFSSNALKPGQYTIMVEDEYLVEKGFTAGIRGFNFETPLRGGYVELGEIQLSRTNGGTKNQELVINLTIDKSNSIKIVGDNPNLIHLPPKFGFDTSSSLENVSKPNVIYVKELSDSKSRQLAQYKAEFKQRQLSLQNSAKVVRLKSQLVDDEDEEDYVFELYIGEFFTMKEALGAIQQNNLLNTKIIRDIGAQSQNIYRVKLGLFDSRELSEYFYKNSNFSDSPYKIVKTPRNDDLLPGWVIQLSAFPDIAKIEQEVADFVGIPGISVARKVVNDEYWYCIITQVFTTEDEANAYLLEMGRDGLILNSINYTGVIWENKN